MQINLDIDILSMIPYSIVNRFFVLFLMPFHVKIYHLCNFSIVHCLKEPVVPIPRGRRCVIASLCHQSYCYYWLILFHQRDPITLQWRQSTLASQITSLTIYSGTDQRKHQSSASLAFMRGIHLWPVNSPHKGPVMQKMFLFDDTIMSHQPRVHCCLPGMYWIWNPQFIFLLATHTSNDTSQFQAIVPDMDK